MTIWGIAGAWLGFVAYAVAWFQGGRVERFAAAMLILHSMIATITFKWVIGDLHLPRMILDYVRLLIFGWLCFCSNRWWPLLALAAMAMMAFLHAATFLNPDLYMATASAAIGVGYLLDLTLLLSVCERWLAGEAPAGRAAWARARIATVTRRIQRETPGRSRAGPVTLRKEPAGSPEGRDLRLARLTCALSRPTSDR